jgi:Mg/Co/Ni transporter MgtE
MGEEIVMDIALQPNQLGGWEVAGVAFGTGRAIYRRTRRVVDWREARALFDSGPVAAEVAALRDMKPADVAATIHGMSRSRQAQIAQAIPEDQLADLLQELPEDEQVRLLEDMDLGRVADVVEEMEPDDAADLLAAMPAEQRARLLAEVEPEDAVSLRRLLGYDASTAGGLMTPEPIIVSPEVAVAEALARLRDPDVPPAVAAQVFVCEPPTATPTGHYIGSIGFQRLLREPPSRPVGGCVGDTGWVTPELAEREVAVRLAAYNLVAVAVCDAAGRLLGAVTVDDVLDRVLPVDWRRRR